jgi:hypothetical protein
VSYREGIALALRCDSSYIRVMCRAATVRLQCKVCTTVLRQWARAPSGLGRSPVCVMAFWEQRQQSLRNQKSSSVWWREEVVSTRPDDSTVDGESNEWAPAASFTQPVSVSMLPPCDSRCVPRVRINPRRRHARRSNSSSATVSCAESFFFSGEISRETSSDNQRIISW